MANFKLKRLSSGEFKDVLNECTVVPPALVLKSYNATVEKASGDDERVLTFTISTSAVDRDNDTVSVDGWDLSNFNKSGTVLWAHNPDLPPVAKPLKTWKSRLEGSDGGYVLRSKAQFTPKDMPHPFGEGFGHTVFRMYQEGYMRAVSVGFLPKSWELNEVRSDNGPATDFQSQELLEFSAVPVPSNPQALVEIQGKGLNVAPLGNWASHALDTNWSNPTVTRSDIELVYSIAKGSPASVVVPDQISKGPKDDEEEDKPKEDYPKNAITYAAAHQDGFPLADQSDPWDAAKQVALASIKDLKKICAWSNSDKPDAKSSYKLPHHRASDRYTVWRGVSAAMGALLGARGGVAIPERDRRDVYEHLAKHYREFGKEPPDFKTIQEFQDERYGDLKDMEDDKIESKENPVDESVLEQSSPLEAFEKTALGLKEDDLISSLLDMIEQRWSRDMWAKLFVGLSVLGEDVGHELTPKESASVCFVKQLLTYGSVEEKATSTPAAVESKETITIEDLDAFKKSILETVHNEFVLPVTGKLF